MSDQATGSETVAGPGGTETVETETVERREERRVVEAERSGPVRERQAEAATASVPVERLREYVVRNNPEAVPELIRGGTLEELEASVGPAKAAYERIAGAARQGAQAGTEAAIEAARQTARQEVAAPRVPAGGAMLVVDPASLSSSEKIRRGLSERGS